MALDFKPGDEVITTPFTFAATVEVIALLGGVPVYADIEPDTCNIDVSKIEALITPKHPRHHAGEPLRPGLRHGRDQCHRGTPRQSSR